MDKWITTNKLIQELEKEIEHKDINKEYFKALKDAIDSLDTLKSSGNMKKSLIQILPTACGLLAGSMFLYFVTLFL